MNRIRDRYRAEQETVARLTADWLPGWRKRRVRRRIVLAWLACAVGLLALTPFTGEGPSAFGPWVMLVAVTSLLQLLNKTLTNNIGERRAWLLDERELALRGRYGYVGFTVAIWSMVIAAFVLVLTPLKDLPYGPFVLLVSLVSLVGNVPTALVAWQLPDDEPDPIAEGEHRG